MKNVLFIKAYVYLNNKSFNKLSQEEQYDGYRGIWKISKSKAKDLKYAFAIHNNIIKNVYIIDKWHDGNTTTYKTKRINSNDPKIKDRIEFTGKIDLNMQHFIGKDVSIYYSRGEANPIKYMELEQLQNLIKENIIYPDDIEDNNLYEGSKKQIIVNAYERNSKARQECINKYGYICSICKFDFEKKYGEIGKSFIHVHHITPLSEINEKYKIDPIKDLIPVCPNCHAMLHKKNLTNNLAYSIEEIRNRIKQTTYKKN
jgi:predicted HNH restriction endonuclease